MTRRVYQVAGLAATVPALGGLLQLIDFLGHAIFGVHLGLGPL